MRSVHCFLGILLVLQATYAQKSIKKSILNSDITHIQVDVKNCSEIELATGVGDELAIEALIDGEYEKDLLLNISEKGSTLMVSADFQPHFSNPNDKLSAHKVISIALRVHLPQSKNVHVFGTHCNVVAKGNYKLLKVSLNEGRCDLLDVSETVEVRTQSGRISAKYSDAVISARSKYGNVLGIVSKKGNSDYRLRTITGDIHLRRVE